MCPTLPGACVPDVLKTWSQDVPRLAFAHEPLLHAIFVISIDAMQHLAPCPGPTLADLPSHRANYLASTFENHRKAVASLTKESADAAAFTSILLSIYAFENMQDRPLEPYEPPMAMLQLSRGVTEVFKSVKSIVQDNPESKIKIMMDYGNSFLRQTNVGNEESRAPFSYLLDGIDDAARARGDEVAYQQAVWYVGSVFAATERGENPLMYARRLLLFSILGPTRFLELLNMHDQRALVILAHFFAVATSCKDLWWIGNIPSREILAIDAYLGMSWRQEMVWPVEMARRCN